MSELGGPGGLGDALTEIVADHDQQKQTFVDPGRLIGDVIQIDYTTADFLLHDSAKQAVGGVQQGCLLVAVRLGDDDRPDPGAPRLLLRVVSSTPLPNDMSMRQARFDAAQRVADSTGNWDDSEVTDLFTLNLMRYSGVRCRILGTYQPPEDTDAPWRFNSDVDNFYSGRGLKVYKPHRRRSGADRQQRQPGRRPGRDHQDRPRPLCHCDVRRLGRGEYRCGGLRRSAHGSFWDDPHRQVEHRQDRRAGRVRNATARGRHPGWADHLRPRRRVRQRQPPRPRMPAQYGQPRLGRSQGRSDLRPPPPPA